MDPLASKSVNSHENPILPKQSCLDSKIKDVAIRAMNQTSTHDSYDDFHETIHDKWIVEMPSNLPLSDLDLVIFKDSFTGLLPLNGIMEANFTKFNELYSKIQNGSSAVTIEGSESFKNCVLEAFKKLMERPSGRLLLQKLLVNTTLEKLPIKEAANDGTLHVQLDHNSGKLAYFEVLLSNETHKTSYIFSTELGTNRKIAVQQPFFILLAHELIHLVHLLENPNLPVDTPATVNRSYTNLEEQRTITGLDHTVEFKATYDEQESFDATPTTYDYLNEATVAQSFGKYANRLDHSGFDASELDFGHYQDVYSFLKNLQIQPGFHDEAAHFEQQILSKLATFIQSDFDPKTPEAAGALQLAILMYDVKAVEVFVAKGVSLDQPTVSRVLLDAIREKKDELLKILTKNSIALSTQDLQQLVSESFKKKDFETLIYLMSNGLIPPSFVLSEERFHQLINNQRLDLVESFYKLLNDTQRSLLTYSLFSNACKTLSIEHIPRFLDSLDLQNFDCLSVALFNRSSDEKTMKIFEILVERGVDINGLNDEQEPILITALRYHRAENLLPILKKLLELGADPQQADGEGRTALDHLEEDDGDLHALFQDLRP